MTKFGVLTIPRKGATMMSLLWRGLMLAALLAAFGVSAKAELSLFKALFYSKKNELKGAAMQNYWKTVDLNLENTLSASITKYIVLNPYMQLLYDKQVSLKGRFKETFGLGFTYKIG
jgi:hypothetical protein